MAPLAETDMYTAALASSHDQLLEVAITNPYLLSQTMHSTLPTLMARGKGKTIPIKLLSTAGTGFFYTTRKNVTNTQTKMALVKFDPIVRQRVLFREHKIK
eukprot:Nitzschia sp. Nitz4//scaffold26_size159584//123764//124109//NITZ4_002511-RA/size159584-processed-gene-0.243-mRNA-1//-1//CDS//3329545142//4646//frame0